MTTPATVAASVEARRKIEGVSVSTLAVDTGIADKTLRRRFIDPSRFTLAELAAIANRLGSELEDFFTEAHLAEMEVAS